LSSEANEGLWASYTRPTDIDVKLRDACASVLWFPCDTYGGKLFTGKKRWNLKRSTLD